jgi:hypothetical protein
LNLRDVMRVLTAIEDTCTASAGAMTARKGFVCQKGALLFIVAAENRYTNSEYGL